MIFTLLYSTSLLRENVHRNVYLYAFGVVMYVVIHWLLFSSIGDKYEKIQKYRYLLYLVITGDIMFVKTKYDFDAKTNRTNQQKNYDNSPIIEEINEEVPLNTPDKCRRLTQYSQEKQNSHMMNETNVSQQDSPQHVNLIPIPTTTMQEQRDSTSVMSIPVYVSSTTSNNDVPVYSIKNSEQPEQFCGAEETKNVQQQVNVSERLNDATSPTDK
jgi:hypothetical protein